MPLTSVGEIHENDNDVAVRETFSKLRGALGTTHTTWSHKQLSVYLYNHGTMCSVVLHCIQDPQTHKNITKQQTSFTTFTTSITDNPCKATQDW